MFLFNERLMFRALLLVVAGLFLIFMPELVPDDYSILSMTSYFLGVALLIGISFFAKFPPVKRSKKIRNDIEIPPADATVVVSRDYHKDFLEKEELLQFMFDVSTDGLWRFDLASGKVHWSEQSTAICGIGKELGDSFEVLKSSMFESDRKDFLKLLSESLEKNRQFFQEIRIYDHEGNTRIILLCGKPQYNEEGRAIRMVGTLADVTAKKQVERNLFYSSFHDALTGAKNRQFFLDRIDEDLVRTGARPDYLFGVILIDLDHFTAINDSFSHLVGDKLLRTIADRVLQSCRQNDIVARVGGDEFGIILRDIQGHGSEGEVQAIVRRLQSEIRRPFLIDGNEILVTAAMAVIFNKDFKDVESLLASADAMLRQAKRVGNGGIQFFASGMREKAMELYKLEMEIRKAIQSQEFILVYQPITDINKNNEVPGFEALVRWNNTERGIVAPADFIPMAEETGLIVPMGEQILRMACYQVKEWVDLGYKNVTVAVNFSARQFSLDNMVSEVQKILLETHLHPRNLKLEITEYTAMAEVEKTIDVMNALADMGLQISIDDFGTGYSSLVYLKRYPIHTLKIDRSFIKDIPENAEDVAIIKMVIAMAKSLNLELIAEGVETLDQVEFLRKEGCHLIQGYYFSKPLAGDKALEYLKNHTHVAAAKLSVLDPVT